MGLCVLDSWLSPRRWQTAAPLISPRKIPSISACEKQANFLLDMCIPPGMAHATMRTRNSNAPREMHCAQARTGAAPRPNPCPFPGAATQGFHEPVREQPPPRGQALPSATESLPTNPNPQKCSHYFDCFDPSDRSTPTRHMRFSSHPGATSGRTSTVSPQRCGSRRYANTAPRLKVR